MLLLFSYLLACLFSHLAWSTAHKIVLALPVAPNLQTDTPALDHTGTVLYGFACFTLLKLFHSSLCISNAFCKPFRLLACLYGPVVLQASFFMTVLCKVFWHRQHGNLFWLMKLNVRYALVFHVL